MSIHFLYLSCLVALKKKGVGMKNKNLNIRIDEVTLELLNKHAKKLGWSKSDLVRYLILMFDADHFLRRAKRSEAH